MSDQTSNPASEPSRRGPNNGGLDPASLRRQLSEEDLHSLHTGSRANYSSVADSAQRATGSPIGVQTQSVDTPNPETGGQLGAVSGAGGAALGSAAGAAAAGQGAALGG
ncbi:hypothetical protein, partial [Roseomonas sp. 18066]|uniref:hypothetical protein n=1 Tax=Roseomonas sp. 18066 TaxID=2681412 RepID=UPI00190F883F